jgi:hypothetical protein
MSKKRTASQAVPNPINKYYPIQILLKLISSIIQYESMINVKYMQEILTFVSEHICLVFENIRNLLYGIRFFNR